MAEAVKEEIQSKEKPKYGMWSNVVFMVQCACQYGKSVLAYASAEVILFMAANLLELYVAPSVLGIIERGEPLKILLGSIGFFILALLSVKALDAYVKCNVIFGRLQVRMKLVYKIIEKTAGTSYVNLEDQTFIKLQKKAEESVMGNNQPAEAIWGTLVTLLQNIIAFIFYMLLLAAIDPVIILLTVLTASVGYLAGKKINTWEYRHREEEAGYIHQMRYIRQKAEDGAFAKDIHLFGMQGWLKELNEKWYRMFYDFHVRAGKIYLIGDLLDIVLMLLRNGIAYIWLLHITLERNLTAAQFLLFFTAIGGFASWVTGILAQMLELHKQSQGISIIREFLEVEEPFLFEEGAALQPVKEDTYTVELRNVSYRYPGAKKDTLKGINLTLHPGEKLAVVGVNGAGKTTLMKILCGFYDPTEGQVLLNGNDIRQYNRRDYYRLFSGVFQEFSVLAVSIAEMAASTVENFDRIRAAKCLRQAGLEETIRKLPKGMETYLGKEVHDDAIELSGGQMQRLMLARALYKDGPVLVLDEPTAALDPIAESDIYQRYSRFSEGKSSIFISHRLASTRFCDRIVLLEKGQLMEEGTHEGLLQSGGRYAELFDVQKQYYGEGEV